MLQALRKARRRRQVEDIDLHGDPLRGLPRGDLRWPRAGPAGWRENLDYIAALHGVTEGSRRSAELLRRFGLQEWGDNMPSEFSRGMRQKASIALALVRPYSVLVADEPFDGLGAVSRPVLFQLLRQARDDGAAVILATHDPEVVAAADRRVELQDGRLAHGGASTGGDR